MQQVPCKFACFFRITKETGFTFQQLNFLKRMYMTQHNKVFCQRAKLKPDSPFPPFPEGQHSSQGKTVIHEVRSVSPILPTLAETPVKDKSEALKSTAITEGSETVIGTASREEKQWKEMKLQLDDLPGILARLSKIKLTALVVGTASAGFAMAPVPFDLTCFLLASLGTGLSSCAANSINQVAKWEQNNQAIRRHR